MYQFSCRRDDGRASGERQLHLSRLHFGTVGVLRHFQLVVRRSGQARSQSGKRASVLLTKPINSIECPCTYPKPMATRVPFFASLEWGLDSVECLFLWHSVSPFFDCVLTGWSPNRPGAGRERPPRRRPQRTIVRVTGIFFTRSADKTINCFSGDDRH